MPRSRRLGWGYLLIVTGSLLFVLNAGVSRALQGAGLGSGTLTSVRLTGTAIVLVVVTLTTGHRLSVPRTWRAWASVLGFAVCGLTLLQLLYLVAIARLPLGLALLIEFTAPLLVALFVRVVYRERVRRRLWFALVASLVGLALVARAWEGLTFDVVGLLAASGAALSLATYYLVGERGIAEGSALVLVTEAFVVAALLFNVVTPVWTLAEDDASASVSLGGALVAVHLPVWLLLVSFVCLGTAAPFVLEIAALRHLRATEVSLIAMAEPVGVTLLGWAWFHERLSLVQAIGMVVVLVGIALAQTSRIEIHDEAAEPPMVA